MITRASNNKIRWRWDETDPFGMLPPTPLFAAVMGQSPGVVGRLRNAGADSAIQDDDENTALQSAHLLNNSADPITEKLVAFLAH